MDFLPILAARHSEPQQPRPRLHFWPLIILTIALLALAIATLGDRSIPEGTPEPSSSVSENRDARVYSISYRFGVFSPTNLRIHVGDTVRWKNDSPLPIRVVAQLQSGQQTPEFDSMGPIQPDSYFSYTFGTTGVFGYTNGSNENESGVIIVR